MSAILRVRDNNGNIVDIPAIVGHTPVKGTDYWTEEDRQSIVDDVLAEIPAGSAEKEWRLLNTVELTENVSDIFVDKDSDGNPFECDEIWLVVVAKRSNNTSANIRFSFHTKGLWDCVQTSNLITTNESHLRVHAYFGGAEGDLFVELGASAYANSPVSFVSTLGSPRGDKKLRHFQLNRANADGYFGTGSIYKIYGR